MNHTQEEMEELKANKDCCGAGCCDTVECDDCEDCGLSAKESAAYIAQRILLGGAFLFSLLSLIMLPKIVRSAVKKEIIAEQVLKAGGAENYERLNKEIYNTQDYKDLAKQQVDMFIEQNKAQMDMYKQQKSAPSAQQTPSGEQSPEAQVEAAMSGAATVGT